MKLTRDIQTTVLDQFEVKVWNNRPLHEDYKRLQSFITSELGQSFNELLSKPWTYTSNNKQLILWELTHPAKIVPLEKIKQDTSQKATLKIINDNLNKVAKLIEELISSSEKEERDWGEQLQLCFGDFREATSPIKIYIKDTSPIFVNWGLAPKPIQEVITPPPVIKKEPKPVPNSQKKNLTKKDEKPKPIQKVSPKQPKITNTPKDDAKQQEQKIEKKVNPQKVEKIKNDNKPKDTSSDPKFDQKTQNPDVTPKTPQNNETTKPLTSKNKFLTFFKNFKQWWILLLLLVLIAIIWKMCSNTKPVLPPEPSIIPPIDTAVIAPDEDSAIVIISNRLNVILIGDNQNVDEFAKAFKSEYPSNQYTIVYYDTAASRIQIQLPPEERVKLKEALPQKLSQFRMLIWYESLLENNAEPSDPGFSDNNMAWYFEPILARGGWNKTYGNRNIMIAVIDNGFDINHPELKGKVMKTWNIIERTTDVFTFKQSKHGSHVAGTAMGKRDNGSGISGIAPDCSLMAIQVADRNGNMPSTAVIDGVIYAIKNGANVINLSLGMKMTPTMKNYPESVQRDMIRTAFKAEETVWNGIHEYAEEEGVVIIWAAGNDDILVGVDPKQRSPIGIKVSAVDRDLKKAEFSNYGTYSTISAPGVDIYSSIPNNGYEFFQGTSMAAPMVAGAVGLLKSDYPELKPNEIRNILVNTALPLNDDIGPLLQLDEALRRSKDPATRQPPINPNPSEPNDPNNPDPPENCDSIQQKIDSLLLEIDRLKGKCPDLTGDTDTMKMPKIIKDLDFSIGRWRSTTTIVNDKKIQEEVVLYFDFYPNQVGKLTLVEKNSLQCSAPLELSANQNKFDVNQENRAYCKGDKNRYYYPYTFSCQADANGYAECMAQNKQFPANKFKFRLIKIQ